MPTTCAFQLDRHQPIYRSGEYIGGRIVLRTDRPKRVNSVFVTLQGEAKVQWSISCKSETVNYFGHQQYLHTRANIYERSSEFRAGTHVYVLSLRIPYDCPSSCKGQFGHIAYSISLTIKKPWSLDEVFNKSILVVQTLDLNVNPEFALPIVDEDVKYLCTWPCRSGPISSALVLPSTGYVPKQFITYFLEVDNQSPHYDVTGVEAMFRQHFVFLARKPHKRNFHSKTLEMNVIDERTLRLTKRLYKGRVRVPAATPRSTLNSSYIVFIHYTLDVRIRTGCMHYDTTITAPVVIGTVPLVRQNVLVTTQPVTRSREDMLDIDVNSVRSLNLSNVIMVDENVNGRRQRHQQANANNDNGNANDDNDNGEDEGRSSDDNAAAIDEPPTYESCLPPSFSYATLGSQQTIDHTTNSNSLQQSMQQLDLNEKTKTRPQIVWPQFPDYRIFASTTAVDQNDQNVPTGALLQQRSLCKSYGSLDTDHTGRSLDTFTSSCDVLNESSEEAAAEAEAAAATEMETTH